MAEYGLIAHDNNQPLFKGLAVHVNKNFHNTNNIDTETDTTRQAHKRL